MTIMAANEEVVSDEPYTTVDLIADTTKRVTKAIGTMPDKVLVLGSLSASGLPVMVDIPGDKHLHRVKDCYLHSGGYFVIRLLPSGE